MSRLSFSVQTTTPDSAARACTFTTLHNKVETPVFMPVATMAALRSQHTDSVESMGFPVLLANTYHLLLRPGIEVFRDFGGIHGFMQWPRSVLTDSGGFQIFSLSKNVKITDKGASFRSYVDGREILLTPSKSIETQRHINSDIMMALDQCINSTSSKEECMAALDITARWAQESLAARGDSPQSIFGIVQGGCFEELRRLSASQITSLPFDGFAIGGLAVGETDDERKDMTELTAALLPANYPRYLMGVGTPIDLLEAVHRGVDMFDCILPTAMGQQGVAWTTHGRIELRRTVHKFVHRPLDEECTCPTCRKYSRAYLHHLIKSDEYLGAQLVGIHNLHFYKTLMDTMRAKILEGTFFEYYKFMKEELVRPDMDHPVTPPKKKKRKNHDCLENWSVIQSPEGWYTIMDSESGEKFHSVNDPYEEARSLYIEPLFEKLKNSDMTVWDVGLGGGTNSMLALMEYEKRITHGENLKKFRVLSFEKDLNPFILANRQNRRFPHMHHRAPSKFISEGEWISDDAMVQWKLIEGDFTETMTQAEKPDMIWYDMFSIKSVPRLWGYSVFSKLGAYIQNRECSLHTYSDSTALRAALLASGFSVAEGPAAGPKAATTKAFLNSMPEGETFLDQSWLARFKRSSAQFVEGTSEEDQKVILERVVNHKQFK